jgi:hypothetical protein
MRKVRHISLKAILIGALLDIGGSLVVGSVMVFALGEDPADPANWSWASHVSFLIIGTAFTCLGGFVAARIAKSKELLHSAIVGAPAMALGLVSLPLVPISGFLVWYSVAGVLLTIPVAMLGGYLARVTRATTAAIESEDAEKKAIMQQRDSPVAFAFRTAIDGLRMPPRRPVILLPSWYGRCCKASVGR